MGVGEDEVSVPLAVRKDIMKGRHESLEVRYVWILFSEGGHGVGNAVSLKRLGLSARLGPSCKRVSFPDCQVVNF